MTGKVHTNVYPVRLKFDTHAPSPLTNNGTSSMLFYDLVNITSSAPHSGPELGGTNITINGNVPTTGHVRMNVSGEIVPCTSVSMTQAVCTTPSMPVDVYTFTVSVDDPAYVAPLYAALPDTFFAYGTSQGLAVLGGSGVAVGWKCTCSTRMVYLLFFLHAST